MWIPWRDAVTSISPTSWVLDCISTQMKTAILEFLLVRYLAAIAPAAPVLTAIVQVPLMIAFAKPVSGSIKALSTISITSRIDKIPLTS